jgi:hypothetical protein
MSISPIHARPASPEQERGRARLVALLVAIGIGASVLAYAISPTVRHAVGHAAHSVKHAVSHVLDPDAGRHQAHKPRLHLVSPLVPSHGHRGTGHGSKSTITRSSGAASG